MKDAEYLTDAGKETLATRLSKEGRATVGQLEQYGSQLLEAMIYLESQGVFHRDIKPSNILLTVEDRVKIVDFGLAGRHLRPGGARRFRFPEQSSLELSPT